MMTDKEHIQAIELQHGSKSKRNLFIVLIVIVLLIVAAGGFFVWHSVTSSQSNASRPSIEYTPPNPPQPLTSAYKQAVEDQVAQGLHLSTAQLSTKIHANSDGLMGVAQQQGVDDNQFSAMLVNAFQTSNNKMVTTGQWTQQQSDAEMNYWKDRPSKVLAGDVMSWFPA